MVAPNSATQPKKKRKKVLDNTEQQWRLPLQFGRCPGSAPPVDSRSFLHPDTDPDEAALDDLSKVGQVTPGDGTVKIQKDDNPNK